VFNDQEHQAIALLLLVAYFLVIYSLLPI